MTLKIFPNCGKRCGFYVLKQRTPLYTELQKQQQQIRFNESRPTLTVMFSVE